MPEKQAKWIAPFAGGSAAVTAEFITLPVDVFRIRHQMADGARPSAVGIVKSVLETRGIGGFWFGLKPALLRQITIQSTKMAVYEPLKLRVAALAGSGDRREKPKMLHMALAGGTAGALGGLIGNPADLVKTRMQAGVSGPEYATVTGAFAKVVRTEGVLALWRGSVPMVQRSFLVNSAELAVYDKAKTLITEARLLPHGLATQAGASLIAGFATACVCTPVDLAKTRLMTDGVGGVRRYRGMGHVLGDIMRAEGPRGLYKGFLPTWLRVGPWAMCFFIAFENYRSWAEDLSARKIELPQRKGAY